MWPHPLPGWRPGHFGTAGTFQPADAPPLVAPYLYPAVLPVRDVDLSVRQGDTVGEPELAFADAGRADVPNEVWLVTGNVVHLDGVCRGVGDQQVAVAVQGQASRHRKVAPCVTAGNNVEEGAFAVERL